MTWPLFCVDVHMLHFFFFYYYLISPFIYHVKLSLAPLLFSFSFVTDISVKVGFRIQPTSTFQLSMLSNLFQCSYHNGAN